MSDDYTPVTGAVRNAWGDFAAARGATWQEASEEFDRFIEKVKAHTLREALEDIDAAGLDAYAVNEVVFWLTARADRIEGGQ